MRSVRTIVAVVMVAGGAAGLGAQDAQSVEAAKVVVDLMVAAKMDCVVTKEPGTEGTYVAALLVPDAKLTVVSASFKDMSAMEYYLYKKDCMGAYADLSAALAATNRVVVDDIRANGLLPIPKPDMPLDGFTRDGKTIKFDGDPKVLKKQKVKPADFEAAFKAADETYTALLRLLTAELKK